MNETWARTGREYHKALIWLIRSYIPKVIGFSYRKDCGDLNMIFLFSVCK